MNNPMQAMNIRIKLSTLWIVVMLNMAFADILSFITPGVLKGLMTGSADGMELTPVLLLAFAVLIEIPISMIFLSRFLSYSVNRWANIGAAMITILWIVGGGSLYLHYIFFCSVQVLCLLTIIWSAWHWPNPSFPINTREV